MTYGVKSSSDFEFTTENLSWAKTRLKRYPPHRKESAVMPLLHKAQEQNGGWISRAVIEYIAEFLEMAYIRVEEVASFYSMYNLKPVGKHVIEICTTTPCQLRGAKEVVKACQQELGIGFGETTKDNEFTLLEVECAGACVNAPVIACGGQYFEDLDEKSSRQFIRSLKAGKMPHPGPQTTDRHKSAPAGGPTTLKDFCTVEKEVK